MPVHKISLILKHAPNQVPTQRNVSVVVSVASESSLQFTGGLKAFQSYLRHLEASQPAPRLIDKFAQGYHDYLQMPLQVMNVELYLQ